MSILSSMYSSAAGLSAHGEAMNVVSDNIANVNTVGFKTSRANFEDVLSSSLVQTVPGRQQGMGSRVANVETVFTQGSFLGTGVSTDVAINGDGFFQVAGSYQGFSGTYYTRDGDFKLDNSGKLVNASGLAVQGYAASPDGTVSGSIGDLVIPPSQTFEPQATTRIGLSANLNANSVTPAAFDPTSPTTTSNFSTTVKVFDSLGNAHNVDVYFRQSSTGNWEWNAMADGGGIAGGTAGVGQVIASGTMSFDTTGALAAQTTTSSTVDWNGATPGQAVTFNFGDDIASGGTGRTGITSYGAASNVTAIDSDGFGAGTLAGISVTSDGRVMGSFTNGEQRVVGQLALARFRSNQGLARAGNGLFSETVDSGQPLVGAAGSGGIGSVVAGSLEQSNVDLGQEFVNMIAFQRGYQANSKGVSTADEMLQDVIQMKR